MKRTEHRFHSAGITLPVGVHLFDAKAIRKIRIQVASSVRLHCGVIPLLWRSALFLHDVILVISTK